MTVRTKLVWRIVALGITLSGIMLIVQDFMNENATLKEWVGLLLAPLGIFVMCFVLQTLRISLSADGMLVYFYAGFPFKKLWEREIFLKWSDVDGVFNILPDWFPISLHGIAGTVGRKRQTVLVGSFTTQKKQTLLFITNHVKPSAIHESIRDTINRYQEDLGIDATMRK